MSHATASAEITGTLRGQGSLALRLYGSAALPVVIFVAFSVFLWLSLDRVASALRQDVKAMSSLSLQAKDLQAHVIQVQQFLSDISATRGLDGLDDGFKLAQEHREAFLAGLRGFEQAASDGQLKVTAEALSSLRAKFDTYYAAGLAMAKAYVHGGPAEGNPMMGPFDKASTALQDEIQPFVEQQAAAAATASEDTVAKVTLLKLLCVLVCAAAALVVGVSSGLLVRSILQPLGVVVAAVRRIAAGDLAEPVQARAFGELAVLIEALGGMQRQLSATLSLVKGSAEAIDLASGEVASGSQDLAQRTERAATNLQETASSIQNLSGAVGQSAQSAQHAHELAGTARRVAHAGGDVVSQVVATMADINGSSRRIADIIGVIDGIAFQTNILALNAAVEAARAGEQGRGFAVVASEVRSLAGRSAEAAREIKALIGASVDRVAAGSRLVSDAGATMSEIVASVQRVSDTVGEISAATASQDAGISQVHAAVGQLDEMTQQNAALVEQSAAAAESLKEQARRLREVTAGFRLAAGRR